MKINIHHEGWNYFIISCVFTILLFPFFPFIGFILFVLSIYIYYFFRDPKRVVPVDDFVLSPSDGVVKFIGEDIFPKECNLKKKCLKISIFLNIFNVHVNRIPSTGKVKTINYIPGKFINATLEKSSEDNERNTVMIEKNNKDIIVVSQIAGLIARRIVCDLKINQDVIQGHRLGIIKFGSRVDLYLPLNYEPLISIGQTMIAGETIISNPNKISKINNTKTI